MRLLNGQPPGIVSAVDPLRVAAGESEKKLATSINAFYKVPNRS